MKNLENYGVQEMDILEKFDINGGRNELHHLLPGGGSGRNPLNKQYDDTGARNPLSPLGQLIVDWFF